MTNLDPSFEQRPPLRHRQHSTKPGAARMARLRDRRTRGFICYSVEVCDADINGLVAHGLLDRLRRNEPAAVQHALHVWLGKLSR